jgi:hypothetical protein
VFILRGLQETLSRLESALTQKGGGGGTSLNHQVKYKCKIRKAEPTSCFGDSSDFPMSPRRAFFPGISSSLTTGPEYSTRRAVLHCKVGSRDRRSCKRTRIIPFMSHSSGFILRRVMSAGYQKQLARRFPLQFSGIVVSFYCVCCSCIAFGFVKRSQGQTCGLFLRPETAGTLKRGSDFEASNSSI